jgi:hypothetical protein
MRITTIKKTDTDIQALVKRLYPSLSEASRTQVQAALIKANPHLADTTRFKPDAVIHLPETGFKPSAGAVNEDPVESTLAHLSESLTAHAERVAQVYKAAAEDIETQGALLKNEVFQTAIKGDAQATELAKQLVTHLRDRKKLNDSEMRDRQALMARITKDIDALTR